MRLEDFLTQRWRQTVGRITQQQRNVTEVGQLLLEIIIIPSAIDFVAQKKDANTSSYTVKWGAYSFMVKLAFLEHLDCFQK